MIAPIHGRNSLVHSYSTTVFTSATSLRLLDHGLVRTRARIGTRTAPLTASNSTSGRCKSSSSTKTHKRPPSSAQPTSSTIPSASSISTNNVNPPASTRPIEITLPNNADFSADIGGKFKYYFTIGKEYLRFYKTGLKNVYLNYRASLPLRRSLNLPSYIPISPPPGPSSQNASAFRATVKSTKLSRSSFQLVRRAAYDMRRLIPFGLTFIICGELTPFIVLALGNAITPYTCRIPRQIEKARAKRMDVKRAALVAHQVATTGSLTPFAAGSDQELDLLASCYADLDWAKSASVEEILHACAVLGLTKSYNRHPLLASVIYRPRLQRYAEYLSVDDQLIRDGGGVKTMEASEVRIAVEERGGVDIRDGNVGWKAEREERRWLEQWLQRRQSQK
ncbi:hypothetical protein PHISCL_01002 [Aspergillus sclerotialis]|uniref:Letm1 RBD domain-containing protein n=1 Tax=Aspergillus sclerotialis TaxID=2070753 RepID=A0A3A2ZU37_9EURO|nr:hypothetical protein PHISCL_01002 [Aspergillus sclerotialis]